MTVRHDAGMDGYADLHARIDRLCRRADTGRDAGVVDDMNDVLSEGYARALLDEQRLRDLDEQVVDLLMQPSPSRGRQLRTLTERRRCCAREIERLRARLSVVQDRYSSLRAR